MHASEQIFNILSELVDGNIYPLFVPETAPDSDRYIVYQIISTEPDNTLDGTTGHEWVRVQIDVYCNDYDEMLALSSRVIGRLNGITPSNYLGVQHLYEANQYRAIIEYEFWQTFV
ncbi:Protein of unknown function [Moraxella cuniculi DSM 21768]|uniref:DUF3168 domain-containing protein n=1 Tax=Moraxella cuniculi DSM 21768 TaxID=1122245 RepID=A0A1N7G472_9GAMM|nr:DUF3168 domain-containing protein [Moraxella cuniculi]OOS03268.1 hypothetical protein B0189_09705 [Moraxella cuniculi]SIS07403.1 Protein of unknown function [Moraxella cuniculi DSM 21768]